MTGMTGRRFQRVWRGLVAFLFVTGLTVVVAPSASAHGTCWSGIRYGGAGTAHNYVEFRVTASAVNWHVHRQPLAIFPIDLWSYPDARTGIAQAGIQGTDQNPPYPPTWYRICIGSG
ncbi:hypothetical protein GCM10027072_80110 [Streptomyces bullii]